ncbi:hypothetical protein HZA97_07715 [Candidatus Woesearchaeota archaeon]|nr:hypothetical protein [Candidatus Woesearchaeota archaeon]
MENESTCWDCGKKMIKKNVEYSLYGILIGKFPALVCDNCKETLFSEETSKKITQLVKEKGLWGLQAKTKVGQAGKTLDIRLPKKIIDFVKFKKGTEVTITPESQNKIVITV